MLHSIEHQLETPVAKDIIVNLEEAQSQVSDWVYHYVCEFWTVMIYLNKRN